MTGRVILRTVDQTSSLLSAFVNNLQDINHLLLIVQHPVDLVVITRTKVTHHMLISEEEHDRASIVELVHLIESRYSVWTIVAFVEDTPISRDAGTLLKDFVLTLAF